MDGYRTGGAPLSGAKDDGLPSLHVILFASGCVYPLTSRSRLSFPEGVIPWWVEELLGLDAYVNGT